MPRRRYYRRYTRVVAPKKKWASNLVSGTIGTAGSGQALYIDLVGNSTQAASPTPVIVKAGNFKVQGDAFVDTRAGGQATIISAQLFILYCPEGVNTNLDQVITQHPEWVMAWTTLDLPITNAVAVASGSRFTLSSRLKRNLNSGDRIRIVIRGGGENNIIVCHFTAQYFTCAN